ncbi:MULTISPECIES: hypothetical protein [unclassified Pseudoalteromonas]|uniref:hypothetical protein n=1 Tax=unclassified Pseudoalteromonas TaxID=194690 RepID=UPI000CF69F22|nr:MULTISPECIES: hypothetical protein [unclassified Pseudoalteromonas]MBS3796451.1 hypothetical protein [Pseudoalteromonas sp. BDTF-M6]
MIIRIVALITVFLLSGCDMAATFADMNNKTEAVQASLRSELGIDAQLSWNIHNGVLTQVSVHIAADTAPDVQVQQLQQQIYPIVLRHFDENPQVFQIVLQYEEMQ